MKQAVYEQYKDEINLIKKTNELETIEEAIDVFIEVVNTVEDCVFVNIPKARLFIKEREWGHVCWKGKTTNHQEISDFIDSKLDSEELREFESKLEDTSLIDFNIYTYRFKEKMTFTAISKKLDISTARISESLNSVSLAIQIYFNIVD